MPMEIAKTFVVRAPIDATWAFLTDPVRVASCLPGAAITERVDDQTYRGTITVKVGPVAASYKGTMRFARLDEGDHSGEIVASGSDTRGRGGADMTMNSRLVARAPDETEVTIVSQVNVMGVLAQFGRGMIQDVSDQMFQRFVTAMRAQLEQAPHGVVLAGAAAVPSGPTTRAAVTPDAVPGAAKPSSAAAAPPLPPIDALSFGSAVLGRAAWRAARRPSVWAGLGLVAVIGLWRRHRKA